MEIVKNEIFCLQIIGILVICPNDFYIYSRKTELPLDLYIKCKALMVQSLINIKVNKTQH